MPVIVVVHFRAQLADNNILVDSGTARRSTGPALKRIVMDEEKTLA